MGVVETKSERDGTRRRGEGGRFPRLWNEVDQASDVFERETGSGSECPPLLNYSFHFRKSGEADRVSFSSLSIHRKKDLLSPELLPGHIHLPAAVFGDQPVSSAPNPVSPSAAPEFERD